MYIKRIEDLRVNKDLTKQEVADILHCHRNTYRYYENGTWDLPLEKALILARHYNVSFNYLLGITDKKTPYPILNITLNSQMKRYRKIKRLKQSQVADFLVCSKEVYQRYESGIDEVPLWVIIKLSELYNITVDQLIGGEDALSPL